MKGLSLGRSLTTVNIERTSPPEPFATALWQAYKEIAEVIEEMKRAAGVEEPLGDTGWTIHRNEPE